MHNSIGLYIHIPFCKNKCLYCDFYSTKSDESGYDEYLNELKNKIFYWSLKIKERVSTVYFGGGTPSVLGAKRLCVLLEYIKDNFNVMPDAEITVEINPDTGKNIDFLSLSKAGFNRISVGMQSAVTNELKALGRIHDTNDVILTVDSAKKAGLVNISLDLMIGIPNQTIETLKKSLEFCKECGVVHISSYILKIEENTPFFRMQNNLMLADDDIQADMYLYMVDLISKLGYKQYEISNFSIPGYESKHNINYWRCGEYIGIGPSAHSFYNGNRFYYNRSMSKFVKNEIVFDGIGGSEEEFVMLSLRLKSGLSFYEYTKKFGKAIPEKLIEKAKRYAKSGFININSNSISFTPKGFLVSNTILSELL